MKPGTLALEAIFFASLAGVLLLVVVLVLVIRTLNLPKCGRCGFRGVRRAKSHKAFDSLGRFFFLRPYRCGKCLRRFYGFRSRRVANAPLQVSLSSGSDRRRTDLARTHRIR